MAQARFCVHATARKKSDCGEGELNDTLASQAGRIVASYSGVSGQVNLAGGVNG